MADSLKDHFEGNWWNGSYFASAWFQGSGVVVPSVPGMEWSLGSERLHWSGNGERLHWSGNGDRLHHAVSGDRMQWDTDRERLHYTVPEE